MYLASPLNMTLGRLAKVWRRLNRTLTLRDTSLASLTLLGAAFFGSVIRRYGAEDALTWDGFADGLLQTGAFDLLAWAVIAGYARSIPAVAKADWRDLIATALIGLCCVVPARPLLAIAMLIFIGAALLRPARSHALHAIAAILAVLAIEVVATSAWFSAAHVAVGRIDAWIVAELYRLIGFQVGSDGNVVQYEDGSFGIMIVSGCASSFVLAGTALTFFVTGYFRGERFSAAWIPWLLAAFLISVLLTELRLSVMFLNEATFTWWHEGPGVSIYSLVAAAIPAGLSLLASRRARPTASTA